MVGKWCSIIYFLNFGMYYIVCAFPPNLYFEEIMKEFFLYMKGSRQQKFLIQIVSVSTCVQRGLQCLDILLIYHLSCCPTLFLSEPAGLVSRLVLNYWISCFVNAEAAEAHLKLQFHDPYLLIYFKPLHAINNSKIVFNMFKQ